MSKWAGLRRLSYNSRGRGAGVAAAAFTPADLFAASEAGAWYDPSDLSTLWQDTGGTVPVTADGQNIARIDDKSGNGNHLTQTTAGARPVYKTSGGLHWLLFDGVDDVLNLASALITGANPFDVFDGLNVAAGNSGFSTPYGNADVITVSTGWMRYLRDTDQNIFRASTFVVLNKGPSITSPMVTTGRYSSGSQVLRVDGAQVDTGSGGAMTAPADNFSLGEVGGESHNGPIYQVIIREAVSNTDEIENTESYIADKIGVTL